MYLILLHLGRDICPTCDTDPADNCNQVDCVIKYFGERSYFNPTTKECENVPICLNDPTRDPNELIVSKFDLSIFNDTTNERQIV